MGYEARDVGAEEKVTMVRIELPSAEVQIPGSDGDQSRVTGGGYVKPGVLGRRPRSR